MQASRADGGKKVDGSEKYTKVKKKKKKEDVTRVGFEPTIFAEHVPETCALTARPSCQFVIQGIYLLLKLPSSWGEFGCPKDSLRSKQFGP